VRLSAFFIASTILAVVFYEFLQEKEIDVAVVIGGNVIIFLSSLLAYFIFEKATKAQTGHSAVRNVYTGFVIKFFLLIVAAMLYFYFAATINQKAIIICLVLYLVYNFLGARYAAAKQGVSTGKK
jgi:hypothetical protein